MIQFPAINAPLPAGLAPLKLCESELAGLREKLIRRKPLIEFTNRDKSLYLFNAKIIIKVLFKKYSS